MAVSRLKIQKNFIIESKALTASLQRLITAFGEVGEKGFPATAYATAKSAAYIEQTWVGYASGQPIPGLANKKVDNVEYRNSIKREKLGHYDWIIFSDNEKVADRIEDGSPQIDLKKYLPFPKSRRAKDGHPYSIIPFRHSVESIKEKVPSGSAKAVLSMEKSQVTGSYTDDLGIKRYTYQWAKRSKQVDKQLKGTNLAGIVRFETSTGKGSSSAYLTFRVISSNSPADSWIIKAKPGIPLSTIVFNQTKANTIKTIQQGIDNDMAVFGKKQ